MSHIGPDMNPLDHMACLDAAEMNTIFNISSRGCRVQPRVAFIHFPTTQLGAPLTVTLPLPLTAVVNFRKCGVL